MKEEIKKFLEFNGKVINFLAVDGQYWIALKPICRALGVDYIRQFKNIKVDAILAPALSKQTMQAPDLDRSKLNQPLSVHTAVAPTNQFRNYLCLPEFFVYGWLMGIQSDAPGLAAYKWECYRVLFEHFHGTITGRKELIKTKAANSVAIENLKNKVFAIDEVQQLEKLERQQKVIDRGLRRLDIEQFNEELDLFKQNIENQPG